MKYRGLDLDNFQSKAIKAIDDDKSVLVSAPTGTGKTLIADYLVEDVLCKSGRIIYTAPIKALSNQKYREYSRIFGPETVGIVTGDVVINRDAPLRIMTTEILRNILLQGGDQEGENLQLGELQAVIFDELHFIDDPERGTVWEEVLIYLPPEVRILGLSATLSNLNELAGWLTSVRDGPFGEVAVVVEKERAVPLHFLLANTRSGPLDLKSFEREFTKWRKEQDSSDKSDRRGRRSRGGRNSNRHRGGRRGAGKRGEARRDTGEAPTRYGDLVDMLEESDLPALFFMFSRRSTESCARNMSRHHGSMLRRRENLQVEQVLDDFESAHPGILRKGHETMYLKGIAFHHAGLNVRLKALVEELYEKRLIKLLFCTSTFALGINMPARTVIFEELEKYNGEAVVPLTVRQFMQKAGRAGRRGLDDVGQVLIRMDFSQWTKKRDHLARVMSDKPEPVKSSFNLSFHSVVNLLQRFSEEEIRLLLSRSFLAYQRANRRESMTEELERQEFFLERGVDKDDLGHQKRERRIRKLKRRLEREQSWLWNQFQDKVSFLKQHQYLDTEGGFGVGAVLLGTLQIEEIFVSELIMAGIFEGLSPEAMFGVCTGLVQELPRKTSVRAQLPWQLLDLLNLLEDIINGDIVHSATALVGGEPRCDPDMMALGCLWAEGVSLADIMRRVRSETDIAGDLVGAFRRAKDLVGQLRLVFWEDEERRKALGDLMREVTRDEVAAVG